MVWYNSVMEFVWFAPPGGNWVSTTTYVYSHGTPHDPYDIPRYVRHVTKALDPTKPVRTEAQQAMLDSMVSEIETHHADRLQRFTQLQQRVHVGWDL